MGFENRGWKDEVFIIITCIYLSAPVRVLFIFFLMEAFLMRERNWKRGSGKPKHEQKNSAELGSCSQSFKVLEKSYFVATKSN